jgi:pimeloyl-ACP methyl ester carboxylesterase
MSFAGVRHEAVSALVVLDGFGIPAEGPERAPAKLRKWLDALRDPPDFAPYRSMAAVADRLQKTNPRLSRDRAEFLAPHWARAQPDGTARLRADPKHKLPFPLTARMDDMYALWQAIEAPVLWVRGAQTDIAHWLAGSGDADAEIARRFAHIPHGRLVSFADAGHMLHHDQPQAVARELEAFLVR